MVSTEHWAAIVTFQPSGRLTNMASWESGSLLRLLYGPWSKLGKNTRKIQVQLGTTSTRCKIQMFPVSRLPPCAQYRFSRERLRRVLRKKAAVILHLHTFTSADLHLHTLTPADLDLHTFTPADLDLHTFTSADLLSLFFYSLLRRGRCRRSATKRNPFARNGRWTSKT